MAELDVGDYRNELGPLYNAICVYDSIGDEKYRAYFKLSSEDYIFSKISNLPLLEERYSESDLEKFVKQNPSIDFEKINLLIRRINHHLFRKHDDTKNFKIILNDLCIFIDGRGI